MRILSIVVFSFIVATQTFALERASKADQIEQVRAKIEHIQNTRIKMADQLYNIFDPSSDPQMFLGDHLNQEELQAQKQLVVLLTGEAIDFRIQYSIASTKFRETKTEINERQKVLNQNFENGSISGSAVLAEAKIIEKKKNDLEILYDEISDMRFEINRISDEIDELNTEIQKNESPAALFINNLAMK